MVWRMSKRGRLIVIIAVSIAILFLASGLPVTSNGSQNSGQNNTAGYVKYTLNLLNNTLINGNFVNTSNAKEPAWVAYDPSNGYIYVTNYASGTVSVIDGATNTVIANITVGPAPWGVAYDPSNGYIYVADSGSDSVSVIDGATNTVIATIPVGIGPVGVAYDPSNGYIYVADSGSGTVSVINGTTVIANITVGIGPVGVAYDPSNGYIYVTNYFSGTVSIISTTSSQAIETYTVTFTESGLPPGTQWSVTFDGLTKSSTSNSITFTGVLVGNYTWNVSSIIAVGSGTRYVVQTSSGTISVPNVLSVSLIYVKQYRVTIQPTAGGSTSPSGTFWYNAGSTIKITATPAPGYEFVGWETNSSITFTNSSSATTTAIINSPGTIVALFKAVPSSTQSSTVSVTSSSVSTNSSTSVSTSSSPISSVTTSTTSTSTKPTPSSVTTSTTSTPSVVPTLVVVVAVVVAVSIVALLMIKLRKP